jgi:hypothetical protein
VSTNGQGEYSYVDTAGSEAFEKNGSNFFNHSDGGFGEALGERREKRREKVRSDGGYGSYSDLARDGILAFDDIAASGFEFTENCPCARKKRFANFGKADGTPETIEEARTELGFELKDLLGERGLRHVRVFGGAGEAAGFGDSAEVAELMKFHGGNSKFLSMIPALRLASIWITTPAGARLHRYRVLQTAEFQSNARQRRIGYAYPLYLN